MEQNEMKQKFIDYCNENWNLEWYEVAQALDLMEKDRCPLRMANDTVVGHLRDLADDFERDNDLSDDWFDEAFNDEEEAFFALNIFDRENKD